jgi:hypothetical protein
LNGLGSHLPAKGTMSGRWTGSLRRVKFEFRHGEGCRWSSMDCSCVFTQLKSTIRDVEFTLIGYARASNEQDSPSQQNALEAPWRSIERNSIDQQRCLIQNGHRTTFLKPKDCRLLVKIRSAGTGAIVRVRSVLIRVRYRLPRAFGTNGKFVAAIGIEG